MAVPVNYNPKRMDAYMRLGVKLTPMQTAIVDKLIAAGDDGVTFVDAGTTSDRLRSHVIRINDILEETDYVIINGHNHRGPRPYRLTKRSELP